MATPLSILLPSVESPINPTPLFHLPLPFDIKEDQAEIDRESVRPILEWQIGPALDRLGSEPRRVWRLYSRLCEGGSQMASVTKNALKSICGVDIDDESAALIVSAYRLTSDDPTTIEDFILDIKGGLNPTRFDLVRDTYRLISKAASNPKQFVKTAKALFNPLGHPRSTELGADKILQEFCTYWASNPSEGVEMIEWEYYYAGISAGFESDERFERMMFGCWPGLEKKEDGSQESKTGDAGRRTDLELARCEVMRDKRKLAGRVKLLEALVNDSRTFRSALDLCLLRHPPPPSPPAQQPLWTRTYLCNIISQMYALVGYTISTTDEDEQLINSLYRRVLKEAGFRGLEVNGKGGAGGGGVMELETSLRNALRRECNFLEYRIVARVAQM
ncbi:hypothetical protein, variant [Spizellomyces punctatus DAOM BR117]|uniref:Uncharacterized protein n=1 Tax=Spizellomyces punctatus (strain DAOM BR117) TaxID=645134 RepID=A0A0L0HBT6_SPIPD|nr:hypothetical protein, variant [Spizellomyces punctatus DAOM BR117]KNC99045.1 hypothetical protein, variant [Spizellomyces punctatus DAOM BR117]|eukprot:XP_016607085.1 hypothetical protein, variant [Spizellomyces punctatus DAOM BR117]